MAPWTVVEQPLGPPPSTEPIATRRRGTTVIWDVDGTLISGDTLLPFLRRFAGTARLTRTLAAAVTHPDAAPDRRTGAKQAVVRQILADRGVAEVGHAGRRYASDRLTRRVRPDCLRRWQWHRQQGHHLVLASASLGVYLRPLAVLLGAGAVIATELEICDGRLTGRLATPNCRGTRKAARVLDHLVTRPSGVLWVYANGAADQPLRDMADVAVHVRPYIYLPPVPEE